MTTKTGGGGGVWVKYDSPKPPAVEDHYKYWGDEPPEISERCQWWLRQIERGWRPNRRIASECYDCSADWYGIYIWEFNELICPALQNGRMGDYERAKTQRLIDNPPVYGPPTAEESFTAYLKGEMENLLNEELMKQILHGGGHYLNLNDGPIEPYYGPGEVRDEDRN